MDENDKIKSFTDLNTWKEAHKLVLMIYKYTKVFPKEEIFVLVSQMRRAAISITSNIAEGFSRKTANDKYHFYVVAESSAMELKNQLIIAKDLKYISTEDYKIILNQIIVVHRLIQGIKKLKLHNT